jgi:hypothetical protein
MNYHLSDRDEASADDVACCRALACQHRSFHQQTCYMNNVQWTLPTNKALSRADSVLWSQYFGPMRSVRLSGEERLMWAVLVDALKVLQSWQDGGRGSCNCSEAAQWVNTRGTGHPFSFDSVCDALEIDAKLLRARLRVLIVRPQNSARRPPLARLRLRGLGPGRAGSNR